MPPETRTKRNKGCSFFIEPALGETYTTAAHGESDCVHNRIFCEPATTRARGTIHCQDPFVSSPAEVEIHPQLPMVTLE
jgi:hypothetical protein